MISTLSIADKQMVEIAKAISRDARVVFMDEPTAVLSREETNFLFKQVRKLRDKGTSFVFVSHKLDEVMELTDRVTVLRDGQWVKTAPTAMLDGEIHRPADGRARAFKPLSDQGRAQCRRGNRPPGRRAFRRATCRMRASRSARARSSDFRHDRLRPHGADGGDRGASRPRIRRGRHSRRDRCLRAMCMPPTAPGLPT